MSATMDDIVDVTLPLSRAAAERLSDEAARARLGAILSLALSDDPDALTDAARLAAAPRDEREHRFAAALASVREASLKAGLTPDDIEDELAARKRERRSDPPRP